MQKIFDNPAEIEKLAKEKYAIPQFLMMENAAKAMADFIETHLPEDSKTPASVTIVCGKGNNGGDGYAVARLLQTKCKVAVICVETPATEEAKAQFEMCKRLGIEISKSIGTPDILVDCIYGTGFRGELSPEIKELIDQMNKSRALKIACDIPSGLYFNADYTITMGCQKLALYSDTAKAVCGKIIVADLGISREKFEGAVVKPVETTPTSICLVEPADITMPYRKNRAAHKGTYGHTAVMCGEKAGAAILSATAAMNFGSGLTSLIQTAETNLSQFKISPSLMISDTLPKKTTVISAGSGFTQFSAAAAKQIRDWFVSQKSPAAVFDAGFVTAAEFPEFLRELNDCDGARIVITPHLAELGRLLENLGISESLDNRAEIGRRLNSLFPRTTVIMKSANTFIADGGLCFVVADGAQSLAKGGSGDILAGFTAALLAQGYSAKDAAITAAEYHALLSQKIGEQAFNLSPEKLLENTSIFS